MSHRAIIKLFFEKFLKALALLGVGAPNSSPARPRGIHLTQESVGARMKDEAIFNEKCRKSAPNARLAKTREKRVFRVKKGAFWGQKGRKKGKSVGRMYSKGAQNGQIYDLGIFSGFEGVSKGGVWAEKAPNYCTKRPLMPHSPFFPNACFYPPNAQK